MSAKSLSSSSIKHFTSRPGGKQFSVLPIHLPSILSSSLKHRGQPGDGCGAAGGHGHILEQLLCRFLTALSGTASARGGTEL